MIDHLTIFIKTILLKLKILIFFLLHPGSFIFVIFFLSYFIFYPTAVLSLLRDFAMETINIKPISITIRFPENENIRKKSTVYLENKECEESTQDKSEKNIRLYQCFSPKNTTNQYNFKYWYDDVKIIEKDIHINNNSHVEPIEKNNFPLKIKMVHPAWEEKNGILYFKGTIDYMDLLNGSESFPRDIKKINLCSVPINVEEKKFKIKWDKLKDYYYTSCKTFLKTELFTSNNSIPEQYFHKIFHFNPLNKSDYEVVGEVNFKNSILSFSENKKGKNSSSIVLQKNIDESFELKLDVIEFNKNNSLQFVFITNLGDGNDEDNILKIENSTITFNQKTFTLEQDVTDSLPIQLNITMIKKDNTFSNISLNIISQKSDNNKKITQSNMQLDPFKIGKTFNLKIASYLHQKTKNNQISIQNCTVKKYN